MLIVEKYTTLKFRITKNKTNQNHSDNNVVVHEFMLNFRFILWKGNTPINK